MAKVRVTLDSSGVLGMLSEAGVRAALIERADRVVAAAKASAPVASGDYRDSIHRVSATESRAIEMIVADDWKSHIIESRTGNLARALSSMGVVASPGGPAAPKKSTRKPAMTKDERNARRRQRYIGSANR